MLVVVNSNWSCLLISASKVHWRVQPTAARRSRFNKMHGTLRALHESLNNASSRTNRKWLKMNNCHLITHKFEWNGDIVSGERLTKLFWNHRPKPKTIFELKVALEKTWDNFPQVQLIKLSRVLQVVWQEYANSDGRHSELFLYSKKCYYLRCLRCLEQLRQFLTTLQLLSCHV